jgi:hypothetical protein
MIAGENPAGFVEDDPRAHGRGLKFRFIVEGHAPRPATVRAIEKRLIEFGVLAEIHRDDRRGGAPDRAT